MRKMEIILASASPRRKELLEQIGLSPRVIPSLVKETAKADTPGELVMELAREKAMEVAARLEREERESGAPAGGSGPARLVVGADTVVAVDGDILGKPKTEEEARAMIRRIAGRTHQVFTGVALAGGGRCRVFAAESLVEVYPMTEEEIASYVAAGESMDKAGAYGIQGRFAAFIKKLSGSYTNVMGLPVGRLYQEMKAFSEGRESDD